jgi:hypothetical protein
MEPQLRYFATVARTGNFLIRPRISVRRRSRTSLLAASEISASNSSGESIVASFVRRLSTSCDNSSESPNPETPKQ